jgi:hypothetical protein
MSRVVLTFISARKRAARQTKAGTLRAASHDAFAGNSVLIGSQSLPPDSFPDMITARAGALRLRRVWDSHFE